MMTRLYRARLSNVRFLSSGNTRSLLDSSSILTYPPSGRSDTQYSVSRPARRSTLGPKPSENVSTFTPKAVANRKCPSSCTKIPELLRTTKQTRSVMDSMTFKQPIQIGDVVTCTAHVTYVSKSSMEVNVEVHAENPISGQVTHTNSAYLVFVALDDAGRPGAVPPLALETDRDRAEYAGGEARQKARLSQRRA